MSRRRFALPAVLLAVAVLPACTGKIVPQEGRVTSYDPASPGDADGEDGSDGGENDPGSDGTGSGTAPNEGTDNGMPSGGDMGPQADADGGVTVPVECDDDARAIGVSEVALYQSVKVSLARRGSLVDHETAVVAGRAALVRIFVEPEAGFATRELVARLTLTDSAGSSETFQQRMTVSASSQDATLTSTFNFDLTAERVANGTTYSLSLHETSCVVDSATPSATQRFPATGEAALNAKGPSSGFRVVLVPVRYAADGSGRIPAADAVRVAGFRDHLQNLFPVNDVEVSVRAPMDWDDTVESDGNGWSQLLDQCIAQRRADGADPSVYYYCMFNPDESFASYCRGGCVAGLGFVPFVSDSLRRGAIGLGFGDAAATMAHELGHALGLPHAPCGGVDGADPEFPYSGGKIGSWGYDRLRGKLLAPENHTDLMGYCDSSWISDYNYRLIFERLDAVIAAPQLRTEAVERLSVVVDADLSLHLGHTLTLPSAPEGETVAVQYLDEAGQTLAQVTGTFMAVTHISGGIVYLPSPPAGAARANLEGFGSVDL